MRTLNLLKISQQLAREIRAVEKLYRYGHYDEVLKRSDQILARYPGLTSLLILRGMAIQLRNTDHGDESYPTLRDARNSLEMAVQLDSASVEALNELAHFNFAVLDNNPDAWQLFRRGVALSFGQLKKMLVGLYETALYVERFQEARQTLKRLKTIFPRDSEIVSLEMKNGRERWKKKKRKNKGRES